jgi:hypothetical protein
MKPNSSHYGGEARKGFVLVAVLVFIFLLSMLAASLLFRSQGEEIATNASAGAEQAWLAATSGIEEAIRIASEAPAGSTDWQDSPSSFRQRLVYDDGADKWYFTVFSTAGSDALVEIRHGLDDDASRLNLNYPGKADVTKVPRITPALADTIRQFTGKPARSAAFSEFGRFDLAPAIPSETQIISGTSVAPHGPLSTLDELLLAPGFTWSFLHGEDANLNGRLDPNEDDGDEHFPPDNRDGRLDHGLAQYFTVESYDPNRTNAGQTRANLNDSKDPLPQLDFPPGFTNYVMALRAAKIRLSHPSDALESTLKIKDEKGVEAEMASGVTKDELPRLLDLFSTDNEGRHDGLINLNTASATVLATLPAIDGALAETIVSTRSSISPERRATIAWLYQDGLVDATRFKAIAPSLVARSYQFHFHVIGYGIPSGRYRVLEAGIDVAGTERRVTYLRDITRLGMPFELKGNSLESNGEGAGIHRPKNPHLARSLHG